ncbi:MBL fold metallo-hydrolase [Marinicauda algicola]|uniref:MBL fold metallo-hydrolase n=1 Tax=Marinicauda algicola TaxID=2029849 RepID=A0A4S2GXK7_9PROT|nr:MBL fold metallo-hydrolase [Marinicauda algicola]TGY87920.1 MBL fold metallo-hydrolase [Marinicauda algicola]
MSAGAVIRARILGCGSSGGVPRADGDWGACNPRNARNRRLRCSLLVERAESLDALEAGQATRVLVDTSPDLRQQLIAAGGPMLDAIVYTHAHADQSHGIDDVRAIVYRKGEKLPAYMNAPTRADLTHRFAYIFQTPPGSGYPPLLEARDLPERGTFTIEGAGGTLQVTSFPVAHGRIVCAGLRFGPLAYTPDVSAIEDDVLSGLDQIPVWILDALREKPHPTHAHVGQALDWLARARAGLGILTNLHVDLDYAALLQRCPERVRPAYDGLTLTLEETSGRVLDIGRR